MFTKVVELTYKGQDGLGLSGKAGRGKIWVGLSTVMSEETHIPPAPGCEAAQPNHANPNAPVHFCVLSNKEDLFFGNSKLTTLVA